jgi:hypothetical protein
MGQRHTLTLFTPEWQISRPISRLTTKDDLPMDERLNQALRTLRAMRQRYETGSAAGSGCIRSYMVEVSLDYAICFGSQQ